MTTYTHQMQSIFDRFREEVSDNPISLRVVAKWAIDNDLWQPHESDMLSKFAEQMARALREEYRVDAKGRRYRAKHAVRESENGKQLSFWADIDTAPRLHMVKAFAQRRIGIVGDCHQLRVDVDHYNDMKPNEEPIQLVLDFTEDVEERLYHEMNRADAA